MKLGNIFGATFISVIAALIIYDLVVKGLLSKFTDGYDGTENFNDFGQTKQMQVGEMFVCNGKTYRVVKSTPYKAVA